MTALWLATLPCVFALLVYAKARRQAVERGAYRRALGPGIVATAEGDFTRAAQIFARVADASEARSPAFFEARLYEARAHLCAGRFDDAARLLAFVENSSGVLRAVKDEAQCERALVFALRGKLDDAQSLYEATMKSFASSLEVPVNLTQRLALVNAVVAARRDRAADGLRVLESRWPMIAHGGGSTLRLALLVRALLAASTTGPRDAAQADRWVAAARAVNADVLLPMTLEWPAMITFTQSVGLRAPDVAT